MIYKKNDYYFIGFVLSILLIFIRIIYIKFLSIFLVLPCIILILLFINYIKTRDENNIWNKNNKPIYIIITFFIIFAFISRSLFQTFEFVEAFWGYFKTNIVEISDYEKIDYSRNSIFWNSSHNMGQINRDLYIIRPCDKEQSLKYIEEIIGFSDKPVLYQYSENVYHVKTNYNNKKEVTFTIHFLDNYNLIEIQT